MIRKLIERPIAVSMSIIAVLVLGFVAIGMLPVSLMPNIDIPQITVQVTLKGASAREIDALVIKPLRNQLFQISGLEDLTCEANNSSGTIHLRFSHNSNIDFSFIEVNEKIDRTMQYLPDGCNRPKVIKANATDIPIFFIDISTNNQSVEKFMELSKFAKEVIAKRIEQIPQVAMVDISGILGSQYIIEPDNEKLKSLGISANDLENAIVNNNITLGNLSIKDGYYLWNISFDSEIKEKQDIENINLNIHNRLYLFKDLANVKESPENTLGMVRSNGKRAITFAVIKQSDARIKDLKKELNKLTETFKKEYSDINFEVSRNQTELLDYSIDNLRNNIIVGAILAVLVIFLFLKDFRSALLICITIPLSLVISLLLLYVMGISINIISLSGLILGMGMMVDNSIIVIDNITQYRERGFVIKESIVKGTNEVFTPLLSSVLTTCAVFVPLIFLNGIAGALFYDQAMAVTVSLFSSLFVAVLAIPVYYYLFYVNKNNNTESRFLKKIQFNYDGIYEKGILWFFRHQKSAWSIFLLLIPLTALLFVIIDKSKLPPITHNESILQVDWNEPVSLEINDSRIKDLLLKFKDNIEESNVLIGSQDFLLSHTKNTGIFQAQVYIKAESSNVLKQTEKDISAYLKEQYPQAIFSFEQATNIFNLIFSDDEPNLVAMIKSNSGEIPQPDELNAFLSKIKKSMPELYIEPVLWQEQILFLTNRERMSLYNISYSQIYSALSRATKENTLFSIKSGSFAIPVVFGDDDDKLKNLLGIRIMNRDSTYIPLSFIVTEKRIRDLKSIISGKEGDYYPLNISAQNKDIPTIVKTIDKITNESGLYSVSYKGGYYSGRVMIHELAIVLIVALLLLIFILAAQFESIIQPFIILSEITVDIFGALFLLWICGAGLNLMSMIGIVVMCGIVINDSILKVDTINKLRKSGYSLLRSVLMAGAKRLKPILMTSLTTILAIAPFLIRGNMGSDLQFPLSVALIGGMILGTMVSIFYIPILYYELYRRRK